MEAAAPGFETGVPTQAALRPLPAAAPAQAHKAAEAAVQAVALGSEYGGPLFVAAETHDSWVEELASLQRIGYAAQVVQSVLAFGEDTSVSASLGRIAVEARSVQLNLVCPTGF